MAVGRGSLNKSVFTRGQSLSDIAKSNHFNTFRSSFKGIDAKIFPVHDKTT